MAKTNRKKVTKGFDNSGGEIKSDVMGSYTGMPDGMENTPVQDADDL